MDNANKSDLTGVIDYSPNIYNSLKYMPIKQNNISSTQSSLGTTNLEPKSSQTQSGRIFVNQNYSSTPVSSANPPIIMPNNPSNLVFNPTTITTTSNTTTSPTATVMLNQLGAQTVLNSGSFNTDLSAINPSVSIMMKPIGSSNTALLSAATLPASTTTTTTITTTKKPNDKFINIGIESIKINGAVPFKQLRNPLKNDNSRESTNKNTVANSLNSASNSSTNMLPSTTTTTTTTTTVFKPDSHNKSFQNKLNKLKSINQKSVESSIKDDQSQLQKHEVDSEKLGSFKTVYTEKTNDITPAKMLETSNNQSKNNGQSDNENSALCNSPHVPTRSASNSSNRKEKKSSVGYRLGKRKLLFEKRRQISDYALIFAMTGIFLMVIETELSMSGLYDKSSIYSIITKSLITCTTIILVSLILLYHALEVQVSLFLNKIVAFCH